MTRSRGKQALIGTLLVVTLGATGCAQAGSEALGHQPTGSVAASSSDGAAEHVLSISGFPLDRTYKGLVTMPDVDTIVVISEAAVGEPMFTGAPQPGGWDAPGEFIVTPVDASVSRVFRGTAKTGDAIRLVLGGGRIGDYEVISDSELSAQLEDVANYSRLVVAGKTSDVDGLGRVVDPYFVYGVGADGQAVSLMASASNGVPSFPVSALENAGPKPTS